MVTYLAISFSLAFSLIFSVPSKVSAACTPGACTLSGVPCSAVNPLQPNAGPSAYCCTGTNGAAECNQLKNRTTTGSTTTTGGSFGSSTDPTGSCGAQAIDTALGCIPVSTEGFTISLLKFLAGVTGAIALVIMLMATIQIMTGGDNTEQVKKGKELFTGAITGLLFIIFSVTLLRVIAGDIIKLPGFGG